MYRDSCRKCIKTLSRYNKCQNKSNLDEVFAYETKIIVPQVWINRKNQKNRKWYIYGICCYFYHMYFKGDDK